MNTKKTTKPVVKNEMNLMKLIEQFGTDEKCRERLELTRWPNGVDCPRCNSKKVSKISEREQFHCNGCQYHFSVTTGTIFHDSHLPLQKWFLAIYLMTESKKGISALQIKRTLDIAYQTAWHLCHRIRAAMRDANCELLRGIVEVDETYVGGKVRSHGRGYRGNKAIAIGAVQRAGKIRLQVIENATQDTLHKFIAQNTHPDTEAIYTDECLLKRSIIGAYYKVSTKHLDAYLDELEHRFNNRKNELIFRDTLTKLVTAKCLTYQELIKNAA